MTLHHTYVGCDVSKAHLDLFHSKTEQLSRIENTPDGISAWFDDLEHKGLFVVLEATGIYDLALREALAERGIPFARVNPEFTHHFAKARGGRAKTDPLDACMLAEYGARFEPPAHHMPSATEMRLTALHLRRDQLVAARAKERTQAKAVSHDEVLKCHQSLIHFLSQKIKQVEQLIREAVTLDRRLAERARRLASAPGLGPVTITTILALMPELGRLNAKTAAALAGLAPYDCQSGIYIGQRKIAGGRRRVRRALYMAALAAKSHDQRIAEFYQRLRAKGKPAKVALIAVARKMIVTLNAMERDKRNYET